MVVEVFKTNVRLAEQAKMLVDAIHARHENYAANFDLDDCDSILRIVTHEGPVHNPEVLKIIESFGFEAEVLPDDIPELLHF